MACLSTISSDNLITNCTIPSTPQTLVSTTPSTFLSTTRSPSAKTRYHLVNTIPPEGIPLPPLQGVENATNGTESNCLVFFGLQAWYTWISNPSLPTVGTAFVTMDVTNQTVATSRICTPSLLRQTFRNSLGNYFPHVEGKEFDESCNQLGPYVDGATLTFARGIDGPQSVLGLSQYMSVSWQNSATDLIFETTFDTPRFYTGAVSTNSGLWFGTTVSWHEMPALGQLFPGISTLLDRCTTIYPDGSPQTLLAANYLTIYTTQTTKAAVLTQPTAKAVSSVQAVRTIPSPGLAKQTITPAADVKKEHEIGVSMVNPAQSEVPSPEPTWRSSVDTAGAHPQLSGHNDVKPVPQADLDDENAAESHEDEVSPGLAVSGTQTLHQGGPTTTISGHEIYLPPPPFSTPSYPGDPSPASQPELKVVIDSSTIPLASLDAHISTALPDLLHAGLSVLLPTAPSPNTLAASEPSRSSIIPALIINGETLARASPPMTVKGHVISLPPQPSPAPGTDSPGDEMMVVVDGTTMSLSRATVIPDLKDTDVRLTTVPAPSESEAGAGVAGTESGAESGGEAGAGTDTDGTAGGNVAGWIMRGLGASSASASASPAGSAAGSIAPQSGGRARNGTVVFTGPSTRFRPVLALGLASLCVAIVASL
ncbi:hypothetical protein BDZ85DRAFT_281590 [Elsinoe ampelina]|uniref:Uncharacterized protein n=1 Tax=Elsinoe ampelina TaxID=302913 RepID=A0A6A6GD71_9PEZI|nr:hypothetical protein BDZ85DRAFT_281590 [Elsinoe ampelina]